MKISILSFYSGFVERGVENWVDQLVKYLSKKHQITVFQAGNTIKSENYKKIGLEVDWSKKINPFDFKRRFYLDYWSFKICQFTKKVLHAQTIDDVNIIIATNGGWQSVWCRLYGYLNNKKVLIVGHSGIGWDDYINLTTWPDVFIALSNFQRQWVKKVSLWQRTEVVPDGVDLVKFNPKGDTIKLDLPRPIILAVSALSGGKRVELAISAVSKLGKGSLVVIGKGDIEDEDRIKQLGLKLLGNRFLLKSVSHSEIDKWYRTCDIFTFPTWKNEAFGMVLLEAMACNKPIVSSDDPIRREIIDEAGLFCDPENIESYVLAITKALKTDFADKPRKQAEKFSWEIICQKYDKLFTSL